MRGSERGLAGAVQPVKCASVSAEAALVPRTALACQHARARDVILAAAVLHTRGVNCYKPCMESLTYSYVRLQPAGSVRPLLHDAAPSAYDLYCMNMRSSTRL